MNRELLNLEMELKRQEIETEILKQNLLIKIINGEIKL
jgi:hypothetical protein